MKRIIFVIVLYILNIFNYIIPNDNPSVPQIIAPSPDAAALGKYGQYPVSMSTGLVQIDIPIYSIDLPLITIPISISYHASGIKVDEISSTVGLGWALNAGGVITRSVKGLPDAKFGMTGVIKDEDFIHNIGPNGTREDTKNVHLYNFYKGEQTGSYDPESDVYYYNACGLSGSFRFDIEGNLIQIPLSNNKIEYDSSRDIFNITGADGTIYYFEDKEYAKPNQGDYRQVSSWYLSKIRTIDGKTLNFEYTLDNNYYQEIYESYLLKETYTPSVEINIGQRVNYIRNSVNTDNTLYIKSIKFPGGSIKFTHTDDRKDRRKYKLSSIGIYNNKNEYIKGFSFQQGYFTDSHSLSAEDVGTLIVNDNSKRFYRLKLDKLFMLNKAGAIVANYSFDYNTTKLLPPYYDISIAQTPNRYFGQDLWGYYNGIETNKSLCTFDSVIFYTDQIDPADRSINVEYAQACILKRITYPTSGYTEFEYEGNKSYTKSMGGLRIKNIISFPARNAKPIVRSYQYEQGKDNSGGNHSLFMGSIYTQAPLFPEPDYNYNKIIVPIKHYSSHPNLPLSYNGGAPVFYEKVIDFEGYPEICNGKTEHFFLYFYNDVRYYSLSSCFIPSITPGGGGEQFATRFNYTYEDRSWARNKPTRIDVYKKEGETFSLIKRTEYLYKIFNEGVHKIGFRSFSNYDTSNREIPTHSASGPLNTKNLYQYTDFLVTTGLLKLVQVRDTTYFGDKKVSQSTLYYYDRLFNQYEVTSEYQTNSDGSILKKNYKYPNDLKETDATYNTMSQLNIISPVILQTDSLNNDFLQSAQTYYQLAMPATGEWYSDYIIQPSHITKKTGADSNITEITYHKYDDYGNLLSYSRKDNLFETIMWGYDHTLPIARFSNITYSSVTSNPILMNYLNQLQSFTTLNNSESRRNLESINQAIRLNLPQDVKVITCTYQPLIGITSITDSSGLTTYYQYDDMGRLKRSFIIEKDLIGEEVESTLQEYDYHFAGK